MSSFNASEQTLIDVWETHMRAEFELKDADAAIDTMTDNPVLIHVPVGTGATGKEALRKFYAEQLIPHTPEDTRLELLTRNVTKTHVIDEFILHFTHSMRMDWYIPGVDATDIKLSIPHVAVIAFEEDKISSEHIYWDNATVLKQLGLLDPSLPVLGQDQKDRLINPNAKVNQLITM